MAFPAPSLDIAGTWQQIVGSIRRVKNTAAFYVSQPALTRIQVLDYAAKLAADLANLDSYTTVPGLQAYVREQVNDPTLDLAAEWAAVRAQIVATQDWMVSNFPNTSWELRVYTFDASKKPVDINLTAPQLSAFKTQLNALIATIAG